MEIIDKIGVFCRQVGVGRLGQNCRNTRAQDVLRNTCKPVVTQILHVFKPHLTLVASSKFWFLCVDVNIAATNCCKLL